MMRRTPPTIPTMWREGEPGPLAGLLAPRGSAGQAGAGESPHRRELAVALGLVLVVLLQRFGIVAGLGQLAPGGQGRQVEPLRQRLEIPEQGAACLEVQGRLGQAQHGGEARPQEAALGGRQDLGGDQTRGDAAQALVHRASLVTMNAGDYADIPELAVLAW